MKYHLPVPVRSFCAPEAIGVLQSGGGEVEWLAVVPGVVVPHEVIQQPVKMETNCYYLASFQHVKISKGRPFPSQNKWARLGFLLCGVRYTSSKTNACYLPSIASTYLYTWVERSSNSYNCKVFYSKTQHVDRNGTRTNNILFMNPALIRYTTLGHIILLDFYLH